MRIKLVGHAFQYEVFQIASLFYDKSQIHFVTDGESDVVSIFDEDNKKVYCKMANGLHDEISLKESDIKKIKNSIKMTLLRCFKRTTGQDVPWGILVGIRPTKIVHDCFKKDFKDTEIIEYLINEYDVNKDKAQLALEVAKNERKFLDQGTKNVSLYVGIPFCPTRCVYCSFTSNSLKGNERLVEEYLDALIREINFTLEYLAKNNFSIDTLYIGGGTPTSLTAGQLERLFSTMKSHIQLDTLREFTVEAGRPDSIDEEKLRVIKGYGCTRISINPQSMNDETLLRIGRKHTAEDIIEKFEMARKIGFDNINMDIIIGLPEEGLKEIENTMNILKNLSPESITIHTMAIKRASILNQHEYKNKNHMIDMMYENACSASREIGMYPYYMYRQKNMVSPLENVGYCKGGRECIYNIQMIAENKSIISMGADAVTKLVFPEENRIERSANVKDVREYIARIDEMIERKIMAIDMLTK
ncbi:coproporphyrinogen III oxidase [Fervidicella metallireducens AeB]|uniref:Coproporphyrinogen III oxidase n=1 Tax=Fervidicella metallireducens AeB TaxID=1403537 RepID=A0A017RYJ2_9CLOT|nr:coproporphyrinogen III oxidase [Fervidicella metallireducens AeB]